MPLLKRIFIISLIILSIISNGCTKTYSYGTSYVSNGILFKLSTHKMYYKLGEEVQISAYVENQTAEDFHYMIPSLGSHLYVRITSQDESGVAFNSGGEGWGSGMIRPDAIGYGDIEAGGRISLDATWNQMLFYWGGKYSGERPVEPGRYTITAYFEAYSFEPLSMDIWIEEGASDYNNLPEISVVTASDITETSVTITWTTDEATTGRVEYGRTIAYGAHTALIETLLTSHSVTLTGLMPGTTYHYRVKSMDDSGNESISGDNTFSTIGGE